MELLKLNGFIEVSDIKIEAVCRFIMIEIKTIQDYEKEKIELEQEYLKK